MIRIINFSLLFLPLVFASYSKYYYMEEACGREIDMATDRIETAKLKLVRYSDYRSNMNCVLKIKAPVSKRIMIYFTKLDIKEKRIRIGYSCEDYLELFDGQSTSSPRVSGLRHSQICGEDRPKYALYTSGQYLTLRFYSDWSRQDDGFSLYFTSFHTGPCNSTEVACRKGQCISKSLKCDGYNQCGDYSDECTLHVSKKVWQIVLGVGAVVIIGIVVAVIFFRRRRQQRGSVRKQNDPSPIPMTTQPVPPPQQYPGQQPAYPQPGGYPQPTGYQQPGYAQQPGYQQPAGYPQAGYPQQPPVAPPPYTDNPYPYGAPVKQ